MWRRLCSVFGLARPVVAALLTIGLLAAGQPAPASEPQGENLPRSAPPLVAQVFADHMVLQRGKLVPVWGWTVPGECVEVNFAGQRKRATADAQGKWLVVLDPLETCKSGRVLTVTAGRQQRTIHDVLVGDVWLCSGQSNMGRNVGRSIIPPEMKWEHPWIRYWSAGRAEKYPVEWFDFAEPDEHPWVVCVDEESTRGCCAVGFFFARRVQQEVEVPIGLLWEAFPGSIIQEWIPPQAFRLAPELAELADRVDAWYPATARGRQVWQERMEQIDRWLAEAERALRQGGPFPYPQPMMPEPQQRDISGFYNGKIHPLVPFAIRGILWYQGESDMRNRLWDVELQVLAQSWRDLFDIQDTGEDVSFYWVQIQRSGDYCSPLIRQEQLNALRRVPNSGMAVLLDLDVNVHPINKVDTGIRLACWALHRDYARPEVVPSGPLYRRHTVKDGKVIVEFDYADGGLRVGQKHLLDPPVLRSSGGVPNVELAGEEGRWHPATAEIQGEKLIAWSREVTHPVHVRYCYSNIPEPPFLYNAAGLPAAAFTSRPE